MFDSLFETLENFLGFLYTFQTTSFQNKFETSTLKKWKYTFPEIIPLQLLSPVRALCKALSLYCSNFQPLQLIYYLSKSPTFL